MFLRCKQTGFFTKYFPLIRGNDVLFLSLKEKVPKRSKPACRWTACAYGSGIPQSPLALRATGVAPLAVLWGTLIVWRLFFWCAYGMKIPPKAYFSPAKCCSFVPSSLFYGVFAIIFAKSHWGLNFKVGTSADLWRHHLLPLRLHFPRIVDIPWFA